MWENMKAVAVAVFLILCSIQDIREKRLSVKLLVISGILFLVMSLLAEEIPIRQRACNMLPGMLAFLLAFLTKEQIGYGDALCLLVLGNLVTGEALLGAVWGGLFLLGACGLVMLVAKKADRKTTLPFLPFLSAGMLWQFVFYKI